MWEDENSVYENACRTLYNIGKEIELIAEIFSFWCKYIIYSGVQVTWCIQFVHTKLSK